MNLLQSFRNLTAMRRRAGASWIKSARWAAGLLWRSHRGQKARAAREHREAVERAGHQAL